MNRRRRMLVCTTSSPEVSHVLKRTSEPSRGKLEDHLVASTSESVKNLLETLPKTLFEGNFPSLVSVVYLNIKIQKSF